MRYRELGRTGIEVSEIGFGAWGIGGDLYGDVSDQDALSTLQRAADRGVNFFDTADVYGNGRSERLIGRMFANRRDQVVLATKGGSLGHYAGHDFSGKYIRSALEASLKRLHTDFVDLYQLHGPPIETLASNEGVLRTMEDLVREGKVRVAGISVRSPEEGLIAVERLGISAIQVNFNLADQRALTTGLLDRCKAAGTGVVIRTPLCFGFLTGRFDATAEFVGSDHRATWSAEQRKLWTDAPRMFQEAFSSEARTPAQLALSFCLAFDAVSSAIPGMMAPSEVEDNVAASGLPPLSDTTVRRARAVYERTSFFLGRTAMTAPPAPAE